MRPLLSPEAITRLSIPIYRAFASGLGTAPEYGGSEGSNLLTCCDSVATIGRTALEY
jgi:hypothetical protein